jgi:hypothetical protein
VVGRIFDAVGDERVGLGTTFTILAWLLSTILNSKAMTRHLQLLNSYDLLKLPTSTATKLYRDYAKKNASGSARQTTVERKIGIRQGQRWMGARKHLMKMM